ncbi:MAG TPA: uroporphyrinogen decarboxylase [Candidatus Dormibacteraeota bacterium]|nr:uroporphyrinogen decarboxylase [Candidatus Dormibacteraeota bacterium]
MTSSRFLDAARRQPVDVTPVWFMRQAGRSLPEYRKLRERYTLADIVAQPELCAEVTLQPVRRLGVDAAVMFADIMLPLRGMGVDFDLVENVGPVIAHPVGTAADVERVRVAAGDEAAPHVITAVRHVVGESPVPVICFSGAPFTLASYLIEGRPSRTFERVKSFMYREPEAFDRLMEKLATTMTAYLKAQIGAGASALQIFDSWAGALGPDDYELRVAPHTRAMFDGLRSLDVPRIHFGTDTAGLLERIVATGPDIVSLDWRVTLDEGWKRVGLDRGVQGNLDPAVLLGPPDHLRTRAIEVLRRAGGRPGHIFNLGHGVPPDATVENLQLLVETVHAWVPERVA